MLYEAVDLCRKVCSELLALRIGEAEVSEDAFSSFRRGADFRFDSTQHRPLAWWTAKHIIVIEERTHGISYFSGTAVEMLFLAIHADNPCSSSIPLATASMV